MLRRTTLTILGLWQYDKTLFSGMQLPDGISAETVRDNLLMECAELEILYPDPAFMKQAITSWSAMMAPVWQELYDTTQYEYNPIWNKDGTYRETETRNLEASGESTHDTMGFNSTSWSNSDRNRSNGTDTGTVTRERVEQGNIGVTTTQQMIKEQREVVEFNVVQRIIDDFKMRFCILVY